MTNSLTVTKYNSPAVPRETYPETTVPTQYYPVSDVRSGKFVDEVLAAAKDDRMNTKRAILADIESTKMVQDHNDRVIAACELELQRKDLSEEYRAQLLDDMRCAAISTANESAAGRDFRRGQLEHSHNLMWKYFGIGALIGVTFTFLFKAVA